MILGLGCDIIEISRIERSIATYGSKFIDRIFTPNEQNYCRLYRDPSPHYAVRFAAKEAISKALAVGIGSRLSWLDMEISNNSGGKPSVILLGQKAIQFNYPDIELTLSHCKKYAMAVALWNKEESHGI